jgi:hypothetical protein
MTIFSIVTYNAGHQKKAAISRKHLDFNTDENITQLQLICQMPELDFKVKVERYIG